MRFKARLALGAGAAALLMGGAFPALGASKAPARTYGTSSIACNDGTVSLNPAILWPPNHKMRSVTLSYADTDNDGDTISLSDIGVTEADAGSPGEGLGAGQPASKQGADWSAPGNDELPAATTDPTPYNVGIQLRAERAGTDGNGNGRIYAVTVTCHDSAATSDPTEALPQQQKVTVFACVPHDQSPTSRKFCETSIKTGS